MNHQMFRRHKWLSKYLGLIIKLTLVRDRDVVMMKRTEAIDLTIEGAG